MLAQEPDARAIEDLEGQLENALIEELLRVRGLEASTLHRLPEDEAKRVWREDSPQARKAVVAHRSSFQIGGALGQPGPKRTPPPPGTVVRKH
jgi:hypothetical protein